MGLSPLAPSADCLASLGGLNHAVAAGLFMLYAIDRCPGRLLDVDLTFD